MVSQKTVAATHAALELSPMNKNILKLLGEKYGDLATREQNEQWKRKAKQIIMLQ